MQFFRQFKVIALVQPINRIVKRKITTEGGSVMKGKHR